MTTTRPRTVVACVDGRPATLRAVVWAACEATRREVPLTLVAAAGHGRTSELTTADLAQARRVVEASVVVPISEEILPGSPGAALVAASRGAELIVLGARTPDGQVDETVGSTTTHVLTRAGCPVVLVPAAWDAERRHEGEVVVAADPADLHGTAYGPVALAADVAARWRVPMLAAVVLPREPGRREVTRGRRMLDAVLGDIELGHDSPTVDEVVLHGEPAAKVLELIGPPSGLLVLGARGGGTSALTALGPTCQMVVRRARCPVAVVPPGVPGARSCEPRPTIVGGAR